MTPTRRSAHHTASRPARWRWRRLCVLGIAVMLCIGGAAPGAASLESTSDTTPATATAQAGVSTPPTYRWPLNPVPEDSAGAVSREFERPPAPWAAGHRGVDIPAHPGEPVLASAAGVVVFTGVVVDRPVVSIEHPSGLRTTYEPVTPTVQVGDVVDAGHQIGTIAAGGHCTDCLHWGVRAEPGYYLDPLLLIADAPTIRLYPTAAS